MTGLRLPRRAAARPGAIRVSEPPAGPVLTWVMARRYDELPAYRALYAKRHRRPAGSISLDERVA